MIDYDQFSVIHLNFVYYAMWYLTLSTETVQNRCDTYMYLVIIKIILATSSWCLGYVSEFDCATHCAFNITVLSIKRHVLWVKV